MIASDVGYGVMSIICGVIVRVIVVIIVTGSQKFNLRERLFMGMTWVGKATV